jgi:hypothetical protein
MSIKQNGGVFGRNPTFNDVTIEGQLTFEGNIDIDSDITWEDGKKALFGDSGDLQIYHDSSDNSSYIKESGSGSLSIEASNLFLKREGGSESFIDCVTNGAVTAYHNGSPKISTTSSGCNVTGKVASDGLEVDLSSSGNVELTGAANSNSGLVVRDPTATAYGAHFSYDDANTVVSIGGQTNGTKNTAISIDRDSNDISFYNSAGTAAKLTWDASAESLNLNGNLAFESGKGIDFSATAGTGTSELLDDYEEGVWTPVLIGTTVAGTGTYTTQEGKYTKVGNLVTFQMGLNWSAHTGTGTMQIQGLPFTTSATGLGVATVYVSDVASSAGTFIECFVSTSTTDIRLREVATGGGTAAAVAMDTAGTMFISGHYYV